MNIYLVICLSIIVVFLIIVVIKRQIIKKTNYVMFYLSNKYYGKSLFQEIDSEQLNDIIKQKESFGIFIHQPFCSTSYEFNKVLIKFAEEYAMSFYKISFEKMQKTPLGKKIKYYPSFAIYHNGKLVDFLRADKDKHLNYYKTMLQFKEWFNKYASLEREN